MDVVTPEERLPLSCNPFEVLVTPKPGEGEHGSKPSQGSKLVGGKFVGKSGCEFPNKFPCCEFP